MNKIDAIFKQNSDSASYARAYCNYVGELLSKLDYISIGKVLDVLDIARQDERTIFFIGNGGSAATASHFANDLAIGTRLKTKPFRAMSLTDNNAILTAIANDDGYQFVFSKQLDVLARPGDLIVAISASGNSPSIIEAVKLAKGRDCQVIGLTGFNGGELKDMADYCIHVDTAQGEYGPVEDIHMVMDHLIGSYFIQKQRKC